ncbi:methyltransferase [Hylemonella gracilis str. Niagara R]|uniref:Methyltransferase n=1 Tax=Hylemonella gracilis str. Niagara R TaxID=1458275 RepID=A0A016XES4_9BURK|nr:TylF/MycF/NovP-related O-methyltransferase [Hylemonella gracilis]EYC50346.1 methyltransferase [Hylemonella gracilis str. Niagara R]
MTSTNPVSQQNEFDEQAYLAANPDVKAAVVAGYMRSGEEHYRLHGKNEGRPLNREDGWLKEGLRPVLDQPYVFDGLTSVHNHDFMALPEFESAYARGVKAAGGRDYKWHWRVHIGLWAARCAIRVDGDFVECGVNRGFLSSAIMHDLGWNGTGRTFYLLDTFAGLDARYVSEQEKDSGVLERNEDELQKGFYTTDVQVVRDNFSEWSNVQIVVGSIPETLNSIKSEKLAFLHIDLNNSPPEVATIDALWDRMSVGGMVLLDDYAYYGYQPQKEGMDNWARQHRVPIASLPTGQGLLVKA